MKILIEYFSKFEALTEATDSGLKTLAKNMYFKDVSRSDWRKEFEKALETLPVFDKRKEGYYCSYCKKFGKKELMGEKEGVIYHYPGQIANNPDAIWIVKQHYDGCRGWD